MDAPAEMIASLEGADDEFEVWAENWPVVDAFLCIATQWRAIGLGMTGQVYWQGLDYAGAAAGLAGAGIEGSPPIWAGLRVMEAAARNVLNGVKGREG